MLFTEFLVYICRFEDTSYLLVRGMPLRKFSMFSGFNSEDSHSRNLRETLKLLINNFAKTLVDVDLNIRNNRETLDDLIVLMVKQCKLLQRLNFDGILKNMKMVRDISRLLTEASYSSRFFVAFTKKLSEVLLDLINLTATC